MNTTYVSFNNKYVVTATPNNGIYDNKVYDNNLNMISESESTGGITPEDNIRQLIEDHILFRKMDERDDFVVLNPEVTEERINDHIIMENALNFSGMRKEYEILEKLCNKFDFLSVNLTEDGLTVCCSAFNEQTKKMEQRPWVEITPDTVVVDGTAADLGLYFDSFGYDAFEISRKEIVDIVDGIGHAGNIPEFERIPALLPLMIDKDTFTNCSALFPSVDYDTVAQASKDYYEARHEQAEHKHQQIHAEIDR